MVESESLVTRVKGDAVISDIVREQIGRDSYPSKKVGGRYCLPTSPGLVNVTRDIIAEQEFSAGALLMNSFKDICNAWAVLLFIIPVAMVVGYLYIFLLRYCAKTILVSCLLILISACSVLSFYCLDIVGSHEQRSEDMLGKYTDHPREIVWWIGILSGLLAGFLLLLSCFIMGRTDKVSAVVEVAGDAMFNVQLLLTMPVAEILLKIMFTVAWVFGASYVFSNGDIATASVSVGDQPVTGLVRTFNYTELQIFMICIYVIGLFWGLEFIALLFRFVICYAVSVWYFTACRLDLSKPEVQPETWKSAFYFGFCFHFGSLVMGAAVQLFFAVLAPFYLFAEWATASTAKIENPCVKAILYIFSCCTACVREIMGYVSKGAIAELVLRGDTDFFNAATSSVRIIKEAEIAADFGSKGILMLHGVTFIFQMLGLVITGLGGTIVAYVFTGTVNIFSDRHSQYFLENRTGMCIIAGLIAAGVSTVFMWTLDSVADTLSFCWLVEGEDDKLHAKFAPKNLRDLIFVDLVPKDANKSKDILAGNSPIQRNKGGSGDWYRLSSDEKRQWEILGWNEDRWRRNSPPISENKTWRELTNKEEEAAKRLGYNQHSWDEY
jgi:hypothetical protein